MYRSVPYLDKKVGGLRTRHLGEGLGLRGGHDDFVVFREHPGGREYLRRSRDLCEQGLFVSLNGYECRVFLDFTEVADRTGAYATLAHRLQGGPIASVAAAIEDLRTEPLRAALGDLVEVCRPVLAGRAEAADPEVETTLGRFLDEAALLGHHTDRRRAFTQFPVDLADAGRRWPMPSTAGRRPTTRPGWWCGR